MAPSLLVFLFCYVLSFVLVMGVEEWLVVWVGLEINMFSFISMFYGSESWRCVESMYKYFFVQGLSSGVFLVFIYLGWGVEIPLMMKIAAGPFFFWFPSVMEGMGWSECFFLMTLQKALPLVLLSMMGSWKIMGWGILGMVAGVVGSFGQSSLSSLMAYSSVNHMGWVMVTQFFCGNLWLVYYLVYFVLVGGVVMGFVSMSMESILDVKGEGMLVFFLFVVSMSGVPPFLGFLMKWVVLEGVLGVSILVSLIMVVSSLVMIYVYMRMVYDVMVGGGEDVVWLSCGMLKMGWMAVVSSVGVMGVPFVVWMVL